MIKGIAIFGVGIGTGFAVGYVKAGYDLDREAIQELVSIGKEFFVDTKQEIAKSVRVNIEESRKQTEAFEKAAEAVAQTRQTETEAEEETPS